MRSSVLIVDDESYIRELIAQVLSDHYKVYFANNADSALASARQNQPDLILLDILMPGRSGTEVCKILREDEITKHIPIMILTALDASDVKVESFNMGADDFLTKPFDISDLLARIASKIKRSQEYRVISSRCQKMGKLKIDFDEMSVNIDDVKIAMGTIEYKILKKLMENSNKVVKREALHESIWNDDADERALDPHIAALRKKLKHTDVELKTLYGQGYCLTLKNSIA